MDSLPLSYWESLFKRVRNCDLRAVVVLINFDGSNDGRRRVMRERVKDRGQQVEL